MNINEIIQSKVSQFASQSRFGVSAVPRHVHNGIDSPFVYQPYMTYCGSIQSNGTITFAPKGWTVQRTGQGVYVMTHNLNTLLYSVVTTVNNTVTTIVMNAVPSLNSVSFHGVDVNTGAGSSASADIAFLFTLVVVNNKSQQFLSYAGSVIS